MLRAAVFRHGPALLMAVVLLLALGVLLHSEGSWWFSDDHQYVRWVLEHRGQPLDALDATVFHHRRPATLWAWSLGLRISDGAPWGPRLLLRLGLWLGVAGAGAWAWALGEDRPRQARAVAALLAVIIATGEPSLAKVAGWTSWMASAWEAAASIWAAAVATIALRRASWPAVSIALGLAAVAGLFQEAGWLVAPAVLIVAALAAPGGRRSWAPAGLAAALALGGSALCWSSGNLDRYGRTAGAVGTTLWGHGVDYGRLLVSGWPGVDPGLPAPLLLLAVLALIGWRRWRAALPLVALGVYLVVLLPAPMGAQEGHLTGATLALAAFAGASLQPIRTAAPGRWSWLAGAVVLSLAVARLPAALEHHRPLGVAEARAHEELLLMGAALAERSGASTICVANTRASAPLTLLPLYGADLAQGPPQGQGLIALGADAVLSGGVEPVGDQRVTLEGGRARLELEEGRWALLQPLVQGQTRWPVQVRSGCGSVPAPSTSPRLPADGLGALALDLGPGCTGLDLHGPAGTELIIVRVEERAPRLPASPVAPEHGARCDSAPGKRGPGVHTR